LCEDSTEDSISKERDVEVDQKSQRITGEAEIGQELGFVDRRDPFHRFQLDDDRIIHNEIKAVALID